jgi:hypothetical protein
MAAAPRTPGISVHARDGEFEAARGIARGVAEMGQVAGSVADVYRKAERAAEREAERAKVERAKAEQKAERAKAERKAEEIKRAAERAAEEIKQKEQRAHDETQTSVFLRNLERFTDEYVTKNENRMDKPETLAGYEQAWNRHVMDKMPEGLSPRAVEVLQTKIAAEYKSSRWLLEKVGRAKRISIDTAANGRLYEEAVNAAKGDEAEEIARQMFDLQQIDQGELDKKLAELPKQVALSRIWQMSNVDAIAAEKSVRNGDREIMPALADAKERMEIQRIVTASANMQRDAIAGDLAEKAADGVFLSDDVLKTMQDFGRITAKQREYYSKLSYEARATNPAAQERAFEDLKNEVVLNGLPDEGTVGRVRLAEKAGFLTGNYKKQFDAYVKSQASEASGARREAYNRARMLYRSGGLGLFQGFLAIVEDSEGHPYMQAEEASMANSGGLRKDAAGEYTTKAADADGHPILTPSPKAEGKNFRAIDREREALAWSRLGELRRRIDALFESDKYKGKTPPPLEVDKVFTDFNKWMRASLGLERVANAMGVKND